MLYSLQKSVEIELESLEAQVEATQPKLNIRANKLEVQKQKCMDVMKSYIGRTTDECIILTTPTMAYTLKSYVRVDSRVSNTM